MMVVSVSATIIVLLVGFMIRGWMSELREVKVALKNGLAAKVDGVEYLIKNKWQEADYGEMKISIKELRAANDASHQAIMIELKRTNDILKAHG